MVEVEKANSDVPDSQPVETLNVDLGIQNSGLYEKGEFIPNDEVVGTLHKAGAEEDSSLKINQNSKHEEIPKVKGVSGACRIRKDG